MPFYTQIESLQTSQSIINLTTGGFIRSQRFQPALGGMVVYSYMACLELWLHNLKAMKDGFVLWGFPKSGASWDLGRSNLAVVGRNLFSEFVVPSAG